MHGHLHGQIPDQVGPAQRRNTAEKVVNRSLDLHPELTHGMRGHSRLNDITQSAVLLSVGVDHHRLVHIRERREGLPSLRWQLREEESPERATRPSRRKAGIPQRIPHIVISNESPPAWPLVP
jgi:hypothetical protein